MHGVQHSVKATRASLHARQGYPSSVAASAGDASLQTAMLPSHNAFGAHLTFHMRIMQLSAALRVTGIVHCH